MPDVSGTREELGTKIFEQWVWLDGVVLRKCKGLIPGMWKTYELDSNVTTKMELPAPG